MAQVSVVLSTTAGSAGGSSFEVVGYIALMVWSQRKGDLCVHPFIFRTAQNSLLRGWFHLKMRGLFPYQLYNPY